MPLGIFGFMALWSPFFLLALVFITVVYFLITVKWRDSFKESEKLTIKEATYFILAMVLLYGIKGSPVEIMSTILFSAHMAQMALLYLVVTPLLILGIPKWVWKAAVELPVVKQVFKFMTKPLISLLSFNIIFSIYHIPLVFDNVRTDATLHGLATVILFLLSLFMWWPLLNPVDDDIDLSGLKRIGYILGSAVLLTPACGLIIFAENPLYAPYYDPQEFLKALALCVPVNTLEGLTLTGPELFTDMSTQNDQQLGGVIMKIVQEIVFGVMLFNLFFQWYRNDQEKQEKLSYDPVDPKLTEQ
ncbi:cytochrome c oxidase assembly factor CtaG [Rossellomorea aquimaris]|jgi:putative membrane protein|uniref:Cytochrome c oxidase assembly factor CtaG n=1 Tax=Rossellomorea aquimaris TaxID=189382 RepID=A0A5D4TZI0_9BACI|nr:cytochrome c oxidase assembly factor CtaG [Rossellomorea aquimaris]TYS80396.1 cytochrome c oxidase assembly factor CtaG [Rossellomorea aquimaris]TYS85783.1 cytochrome c oxidase assembly factor CtaG [Rossellomorea aquimaris]